MLHTVYIGTYTHGGGGGSGGGGGKGVYRATLSGEGKLSLIDAAETTSPSYLIFSGDKKFIYAANEGREVDGKPGGAVTAFSVAEGGGDSGCVGDAGGGSDGSGSAGGALTKVVTRSTGGGSPCHLLELGGYLYAANYGNGSITVFPLVDGVPGEAEFTHQHEGSGPDKSRQEGPHAHCAMNVPGTDIVCIIDLGIDQARFYRKEDKTLTLVQALSFPGGAGPRHVVFSSCGRFGWVVTELSNEIYCIKNDGAAWSISGVYPTLPQDYTGNSACAAIRLSHDGTMIAASNRFHDSVAIFGVDASGAAGGDGLLTLKGIYPCGGATPRDIEFSPDDKWLLSANQDSDNVAVLSVNDDFKIINGGELNISMPASILFR